MSENITFNQNHVSGQLFETSRVGLFGHLQYHQNHHICKDFKIMFEESLYHLLLDENHRHLFKDKTFKETRVIIRNYKRTTNWCVCVISPLTKVLLGSKR